MTQGTLAMKLTLAKILLIGFGTCYSIQSLAWDCQSPFFFKKSNPISSVYLQPQDELVGVAYNFENLFLHRGKHERISDTLFKLIEGSGPEPKDINELKEQVEIIRELSPHFIIGSEIEDLETLEQFNREFLADQYRVVLVEGNDGRGIDIGFLIRKDLEHDLEVRTHKHITWTDPVTNRIGPIHSRDFPVVILRPTPHEAPELILAGMHAKSKRDRKQDPESNRLRGKQFSHAAEVIENLQSEFGQDTRIAVGGDFNTDVRSDQSLNPFKKVARDVFNMAKKTIDILKRITHTYHPNKKPTVRAQLDTFFISGNFTSIIEAGIYRYKDAQGNEKPLPDTYDQRAQNPSDHFPIYFIANP